MSQTLKLFSILLFSLFSSLRSNAQATEKVWRINFLNPAIELELPTGEHSTFSTALGAGYFGAYPELTSNVSGFIYIISPFLDLQQKWFYNLGKRMVKGKDTEHNSGNFISARLITKGPSIADNIYRTSDFDFAFGPTWGIQRKYGEKFHLLFDIGPQYYFDAEGNSGIYPMFQINLGFDL